MLILLSPAKTLDLESPLPSAEFSQPRFLKTAEALSRSAAKLSPAALQKLMHISEPLAGLNAARFRAFQTPFTPDNARPALFTFAGDVYSGLDAATLSPMALAHAATHLRILSGLYGVLRPLDLMQPYRLEMGTKMGLGKSGTLYETWGDQLAKALNDDLAALPHPMILNLASNEYWKAVDQAALKAPVLTIDFRDEKDGKLRFNSFIAKRARGAAARTLLQAGADTPDILKTADVLGHRFSAQGSSADHWLFVRPVD
jgi:hypothetical protein